MKRRVVLINPTVCSPRSARFPLSLLSLAAVLQPQWDVCIVDGNTDADAAGTVTNLLRDADVAAVGVTVMPGPQVATAIEISTLVRREASDVPIVWGGFFPTLYPEAAINAPYVDFVVRGQGEATLLELLDVLDGSAAAESVRESAPEIEVAGLTLLRDGQVVHNTDRVFQPPDTFPPFPYESLANAGSYPRPSFLGSRTVAHQAAIGCRFRCTFCGVVSMFNGYTELQGPDRLEAALTTLRDDYGANAVQYYDHNFFDDEDSGRATLEVQSRFRLPWWCYARTDTLANFSASTWDLMAKSALRMTYLGAEAASDDVLRSMKKGSRVEHTIEVAHRCNEYGITPEFSFVLGGPDDPEHEIDTTFAFIRKLKAIVPSCEIILYFYTPTPQRLPMAGQTTVGGRIPVLEAYGPDGDLMPTTPEEWTRPQWVDFVCHRDAPWLTPALRRKVNDFARVLACRFPTAQDYHTPVWGKKVLQALAGWRYATGYYGNSRELDVARRLVGLREPQRESI